MAVYNFDISVQAESDKEAVEKLRCATVFMKKFTTKELKRFAEVIEKEPAKIAFAKKALGL
jgi:hypothetical protein